jgi:hypothetical protein
MKVLGTFWFICDILLSSFVQAQRQSEQEILSKILGNSYDKRVRPLNKDNPTGIVLQFLFHRSFHCQLSYKAISYVNGTISEPVLVWVNLYVRSIDAIDESKMVQKSLLLHCIHLKSQLCLMPGEFLLSVVIYSRNIASNCLFVKNGVTGD